MHAFGNYGTVGAEECFTGNYLAVRQCPEQRSCSCNHLEKGLKSTLDCQKSHKKKLEKKGPQNAVEGSG
jgi:hypothetical protein